MADDGEYNPNADVPTWVNIVVPLALVGIFVLVLAWLTYTDWDISIETLDRWADKIGLTKIKEVVESRKKSEEKSIAKISDDRGDSQTDGRTDSQEHLTATGQPAKTYGSMVSEFSESSCKSGHTESNIYVYESNV